MVNIVLGVRAKSHVLEVPVNHIDLAPRMEETFAKLRRCDIGRVVELEGASGPVFSFNFSC